MLNKQPTQKRNFLKALLILPCMALFLYSFNVKKEYIVTEAKKQPALPSSSEILPNTIFSEENSAEKPASAKVRKSIAARATPPPQPPSSVSEATQIERQLTEATTIDIRITKDTTREELEDLQQLLRDEHGIDFEYSNVIYNQNGEITSISISYRDKRGNNSNYTVQGGEPINTIILTVTEDGALQMHSEMTEAQRIRKEQMHERRSQRMEMRKQQMEERRQQMRLRLDSSHRTTERMEQMKQRMEARKLAMQERLAARQNYQEREHNSDEARAYYGNGHLATAEGILIIDKSTTDAQLADKKARLAEKGITFTYKRVTRNAAGEITGIKLTVDDGEGGESTTSVKSVNGEAIDTIVVKI